MAPIHKQSLIGGTNFPADLFIKLSSNSYLLLARQGEAANLSDFSITDKHEVQYLFVRKVEYKNFVGQSIMVAGILMNKAEVSTDRKAVFISNAADSVFHEISELGFSRESLDHAKQVSEKIRMLVEGKMDLFSVMSMLANVPGDLLRHSVAVSAVSVMIAKGMDFTLDANIEKVALGGMLHDIGMKELPTEILEKSRHELSRDEQALYESHAFRGAEIMRTMPSVPDELVSVAYEHHENSIGQGYPRRLRDFRIAPFAKVVAVADTFCDLTLVTGNEPNPRTPTEALLYMEMTLGQPFNKQVFNSLRNIVENNALATPRKAA